MIPCHYVTREALRGRGGPLCDLFHMILTSMDLEETVHALKEIRDLFFLAQQCSVYSAMEFSNGIFTVRIQLGPW